MTSGKIITLFAATCVAGCSQGPLAEPDARQATESERSQVEAGMTLPENIVLVSDPQQPAPEGIVSGHFILDEGCLLFETPNGNRYNPVLTGESALTPDPAGGLSITLAGTPIALMEDFRAAGGGSAEVPNLTAAQRACSSKIIILGEILDG